MGEAVCAVIGVGPGVGAAVALRFGRAGYRVAIVGRTASKLAEVERALSAQGIAVTPLVADAALPSSITAALQQIAERLGPPEVLVYNAFQGARSRMVDLEPDNVRSDLEVNVVGALVAVQSVATAMRRRQRGSILLTGGGLAFKPVAGLGSLALGKAALRSLVFSLHDELAPDHVHVATVTIAGPIQPGTRFSPESIADLFFELHSQPEGHWETERILR